MHDRSPTKHEAGQAGQAALEGPAWKTAHPAISPASAALPVCSIPAALFGRRNLSSGRSGPASSHRRPVQRWGGGWAPPLCTRPVHRPTSGSVGTAAPGANSSTNATIFLSLAPQGVCRTEGGQVVFVERALPGEVVEARVQQGKKSELRNMHASPCAS